MLIGIYKSLDRAGWGKILARNNVALVEKDRPRPYVPNSAPNFWGEKLGREPLSTS